MTPSSTKSSKSTSSWPSSKRCTKCECIRGSSSSKWPCSNSSKRRTSSSRNLTMVQRKRLWPLRARQLIRPKSKWWTISSSQGLLQPRRLRRRTSLRLASPVRRRMARALSSQRLRRRPKHHPTQKQRRISHQLNQPQNETYSFKSKLFFAINQNLLIYSHTTT